MSCKDKYSSNGIDICNLFAEPFGSTFGSVLELQEVAINKTSLSCYCLSLICLSKDEILKALKRLDNRKGAGCNGIPDFFAQKCLYALVTSLYIIFNKSLTSGIFFSYWMEFLTIQ